MTDWKFEKEILNLITRNVRGSDMRLGDYWAQLGANKIGEERLGDLLDYTERRVRAAISNLPAGTYQAEDYMDGDGVVDEPVLLRLILEVDDDETTIDFTGTADQTTGPLNCTPAMAFAVAGSMAVIMSLLGEDVPKNDGFYRPFETITPDGTMVNPVDDAPVAGGWEIAMRAGELVTKAMAEAMSEETIVATKGIAIFLFRFTHYNFSFPSLYPTDHEYPFGEQFNMVYIDLMLWLV